jgi:hypothetical protein
MESGKQATTSYAGPYARPLNEADRKKDSQYENDIKKLLKQLGLDEEEEDRLFWLRGFSPAYSSNRGGRGGGIGNWPAGSYGAASGPLNMNSRAGQYTQPGANSGMTPYSTQTMPMSAFTRTRDGRYAQTGHNADISIQYTSPEGGRYNMSIKTNLENTGDALYSAMLGFYGMIAADAKGGSYKGGDGKSYSGSK